MKSPILRGFDFPEREIDDQLRLCNPLLSFEEGESAPIFLARDLNWQPSGENNAGWLARVDIDEVESFGTLVSGEPQRILRGEGVVLLGERLFSVAREAGIDLEDIRDVKLKAFVGAGYRIGLAGVDAYHRFATEFGKNGGEGIRRRTGQYIWLADLCKRSSGARPVAEVRYDLAIGSRDSPTGRSTNRRSYR